MTHHPMAHGFPQVVKDTSLCSLLLQAPTQTPVPSKAEQSHQSPFKFHKKPGQGFKCKKTKIFAKQLIQKRKWEAHSNAWHRRPLPKHNPVAQTLRETVNETS